MSSLEAVFSDLSLMIYRIENELTEMMRMIQDQIPVR